jgi:hypothetical protein
MKIIQRVKGMAREYQKITRDQVIELLNSKGLLLGFVVSDKVCSDNYLIYKINGVHFYETSMLFKINSYEQFEKMINYFKTKVPGENNIYYVSKTEDEDTDQYVTEACVSWNIFGFNYANI